MTLIAIRKEWYLVLIILVVTLTLRAWGIGFGLPFSYSFDEYHEVMRALELASGRFNFQRTGKGGLYFVLMFEYGIYFVLLKVIGIVDSTMDFAMHFVRDQTPFYLIGRWTVAIIGTINVLAVYFLGRKAYSAGAGIFAATFLAVNTLHAYESHTINVDIPMITLATFALLYMVKLAESGMPRYYYAAALFAGLATTTKLPAILLIVPLVLAHVLRCYRINVGVKQLVLNRSLWVGILIIVGTVVVTNPGIVFSFPKIMSGVLSNVAGTGDIGVVDAEEAVAIPTNLHVYYLRALVNAMGWPLVIVSLISVPYAAWKRTEADLILLSFGGALYLLFTGPIAGDMYYARYFLPIIVVLAVLSGRMFEDLFSAASRPVARISTVLTAGALLFIPGYQTVLQNVALSGPDTRTQAKVWIENNVPQGARVLIEGGKIAPIRTTVQLQETLENIERRIAYWKEVEPRQAKVLEIQRQVMLEANGQLGTTFDLYFVRFSNLSDLSFYRGEGIEYFVIRPERLMEYRGSDSLHINFLDELRGAPDVSLMYTIEPETWHGVRGGGPIIEVYRLDVD